MHIMILSLNLRGVDCRYFSPIFLPTSNLGTLNETQILTLVSKNTLLQDSSCTFIRPMCNAWPLLLSSQNFVTEKQTNWYIKVMPGAQKQMNYDNWIPDFSIRSCKIAVNDVQFSRNNSESNMYTTNLCNSKINNIYYATNCVIQKHRSSPLHTIILVQFYQKAVIENYYYVIKCMTLATFYLTLISFCPLKSFLLLQQLPRQWAR